MLLLMLLLQLLLLLREGTSLLQFQHSPRQRWQLACCQYLALHHLRPVHLVQLFLAIRCPLLLQHFPQVLYLPSLL